MSDSGAVDPESALGKFFAEMRPFMRGKASAAEVEKALGKSASGRSRLALYPGLVRAQHVAVLSTLYARVKTAMDLGAPGTWQRAVDAFLEGKRATHWSPTRFGEGFADHLAAMRARDPRVPAFAEELADFVWLRFELATAEEVGDAARVDPRHAVRRYTYDVPATVMLGEPALPKKATVMVIVHRALGERVQVLDAGVEDLVVLGLATGELSAEDALKHGVDEARRRASEEKLGAAGILRA